MLLIQLYVIISIFVVHVFIVFGRREYITRLFSEYMLTCRVEEPMKMCVQTKSVIYIYVHQLNVRDKIWFSCYYSDT
jgi:hypothetical protein